MADAESTSNEKLIVVHSAKDEIEAAAVVNALAEAGIRATMQGQHTGSFRAENWTDVLVVTREQDAQAAQQVLAQQQSPKADIDWDQVDVGEPIE